MSDASHKTISRLLSLKYGNAIFQKLTQKQICRIVSKTFWDSVLTRNGTGMKQAANSSVILTKLLIPPPTRLRSTGLPPCLCLNGSCAITAHPAVADHWATCVPHHTWRTVRLLLGLVRLWGTFSRWFGEVENCVTQSRPKGLHLASFRQKLKPYPR